jgi:hypothetical protein
MGVLKRKDERTQTITVRVPESIKAELDRLREESNAAGFDLNAMLSEAVIRVTKQIREELRKVSGKANGANRSNGLAVSGGGVA